MAFFPEKEAKTNKWVRFERTLQIKRKDNKNELKAYDRSNEILSVINTHKYKSNMNTTLKQN